MYAIRSYYGHHVGPRDAVPGLDGDALTAIEHHGRQTCRDAIEDGLLSNRYDLAVV